VYDTNEEELPNIGVLNLKDAETDQVKLIDTTSKAVRLAYQKKYQEKVKYFSETFSKCGVGTLSTRVDESYVKKLLGYFKSR